VFIKYFSERHELSAGKPKSRRTSRTIRVAFGSSRSIYYLVEISIRLDNYELRKLIVKTGVLGTFHQGWQRRLIEQN